MHYVCERFRNLDGRDGDDNTYIVIMITTTKIDRMAIMIMMIMIMIMTIMIMMDDSGAHFLAKACAQLCAQLCTTRATGRMQREGRGAADMHSGADFVHSCADFRTAVQTCAQLCRFVHNCTDLCTAVC